MKAAKIIVRLLIVAAMCASVVTAWSSHTKICSERYRTYSPEWDECVISGVEGESQKRKQIGWYHDIDEAEDDRNFKCDTPLPTTLSRNMFAHESIKERPFCGRMVFMDKTDNLLKEGPADCPYYETVCKRGVIKRMQVGRENVKGSIYYNCFAKICMPSFTQRRLRASYRNHYDPL